MSQWDKKILSISMLIATASILAACAPMPNSEMRQELEGFELPGSDTRMPGMATIYISRPSLMYGLESFDVFVDNPNLDSLEAGLNGGKQHFWFALNPGKHRLYSLGENSSELEMDFQADSTYFFRQDWRIGLVSGRNKLVRTNRVEGTYLVKGTTLGTVLHEKLIVTEASRAKGHTVALQGPEFLITLQKGGLIGGQQTQLGLTADPGREDLITETGLSFDLRHYFTNHLAIQAATAWLWGDAVVPDAAAMKYSSSWSTNFGLIGVPFIQNSGRLSIRYSLSSGLNYSRFAFTKQFKSYSESKIGTKFLEKKASGFGWYAGPEIEAVTKWGMVFLIGVQFLQQNPEFSNGGKTNSGSMLLSNSGFGYRF